MNITTIGIDLAKNVFQIHGVDSKGHVVLRRRLSRRQFLTYFANLECRLIGMEACAGAHYWGRELQSLGHNVRLMPPQYVKPYVKRNKNDRNDAEAICEAVTRPSMRFVSIKGKEQQSMLVLHRSRELFVRQKTMLANAIRGHMGEFGVVVPQGIQNIDRLSRIIHDPDDETLPYMARAILETLIKQLREIQETIKELEQRLVDWHRNSEASRRLATIPGIGPITATALIATVGDLKEFKSGRQFAAWIGLTPREHSSGGKQKQGSISKRGDGYLRRLLIHGARTVVRWHKNKDDKISLWLKNISARRHTNVVTTALANKTARIVWAIMVKGEVFKSTRPIFQLIPVEKGDTPGY